MTLPFYSVGHSTRTIAEFVALLRAADVDRVVDIRTIPRSRTNPQYNKDALPAHLSAFGIDYTQIAELGGRRQKSKTITPHLNAYRPEERRVGKQCGRNCRARWSPSY